MPHLGRQNQCMFLEQQCRPKLTQFLQESGNNNIKAVHKYVNYLRREEMHFFVEIL